MKKFIFVCSFIFVGFISSQVYAWETVGGDAWNELRLLHAQYLGKYNYTTHATTNKWIAQDMNRWLTKKKNDYENKISELKRINDGLSKQIKNLSGTLNGNDSSNATTNITEQNQQLKSDNIELKNNFNRCKTERDIAYSVIAIILVLVIVFILIKKCQAKKLPKVIEDAINENM